MRLERRQRGGRHEDRAPALLAALEALDAVPVRYAGTVRVGSGGNGVRVMTWETVDALVVAVSEVRRVLATLDECRQDRGLLCEECALLWSVWWRWRGDGALDYGMAGWEGEKYAALVASSHSDWPDAFIAEWRWWADRLPPGMVADLP
ncbi:hypothetical protein Acsp04_04940 [Actinomadura sp. NBRC 104425]|uniref:hypothetical protein n=1 Tax=Actinomadura sp. NBRC 104425 TaxID=3032204 RepID=UPI0024A5F28D|nr:hypothetical protein [Actinomadura sp. NBRC 104425]GLZ10259.1 hypothetical protein Acsp04_04940 [Actinomadura sp. NBRC 104425]